MEYKKAIGAFLLMAVVFFASTGNAATETYVFGELYHPADNVGYPNPTNFASLSVVTGEDNWMFRIKAYDLGTYFGDSAFLGRLVTQGSVKGKKVRVTGVNSTGVNSSSGVKVKYKSKGMIYQGTDSGGFTFDFSKKKRDRLTDGEWVEWTVSGISSILGYATHVQAIKVGDIDGGSAWYEARPNPVPLPAAFWLLGSALLGFAGFKKFVRPKNHSAKASTISP